MHFSPGKRDVFNLSKTQGKILEKTWQQLVTFTQGRSQAGEFIQLTAIVRELAKHQWKESYWCGEEMDSLAT